MNIKSLYSISVIFYVISIYIFENENLSKIYFLSQYLFIGLSIVCLLFYKFDKKDKYIIWTYVIIVFTLLISLFNMSTLSQETIVVLKNLVIMLCFYIYLIVSKEVKTIIFATFLGSFLSACFILIDFNSLEHITYDLKYAYSYRIGEDINANPNITALNVVFGFATSLYYVLSSKKKIEKVLLILVSIFMLYALILTGSRKAILFCLIVMFGQLVLKKSSYIIIVPIVVSLFYLAAMKINLLYFYIGYKIDLSSKNDYAKFAIDGSDQIRSILLDKSINLISENPFGIGFGGVAKHLNVYSHNNYIEILASIGLIGFIIFYYLYFVSLIKMIKNIKKDLLFNLFLSSLIGLLVIEMYQVTYLYKIPLMILVTIYFYGNYKDKRNSLVKNEVRIS